MTPYHSMGNGSPERYNQTLIKMLLTLTEERKTECTSFKAPFVQAYKARRSYARIYTTLSNVGMASLFTNDVFFGMNINTEKEDHQTYVAKIRNQMTSAYSLTLKEAERIVSKKKENYDQRFKFAKLEI